jgi:hypothetical protein
VQPAEGNVSGAEDQTFETLQRAAKIGHIRRGAHLKQSSPSESITITHRVHVGS